MTWTWDHRLGRAAIVLSFAALLLALGGPNHMAPDHLARGQVTGVLLTSRTDVIGHPRLPLLLASACRHIAEPGLLHELLVITPDDEAAELSEALDLDSKSPTSLWRNVSCRPPWPIRVLPDSAVLPTPRAQLVALTPWHEQPLGVTQGGHVKGGRGAGYRLQMLLKLGVAQIVETMHYLTLDSDVLVTRKMTIHDLLAYDGTTTDADARARARVQPDPTNQREAWWSAAEALLVGSGGGQGSSSSADERREGLEPSDRRRDVAFEACLEGATHDTTGEGGGGGHGGGGVRGMRIGVTPAVLDAAVARSLLSRLEARWGAAAVATCPAPLAPLDGEGASAATTPAAIRWVPITPPDARAECAPGDAVSAMWGGQRGRLEPARIVALDRERRLVEVRWDDGDTSWRRVGIQHVYKHGHPCSRPLCRPAVGTDDDATAATPSSAMATRRWDEALMDLSSLHDWSEYTLYWAEACASGAAASAHAMYRPGEPRLVERVAMGRQARTRHGLASIGLLQGRLSSPLLRGAAGAAGEGRGVDWLWSLDSHRCPAVPSVRRRGALRRRAEAARTGTRGGHVEARGGAAVCSRAVDWRLRSRVGGRHAGAAGAACDRPSLDVASCLFCSYTAMQSTVKALNHGRPVLRTTAKLSRDADTSPLP